MEKPKEEERMKAALCYFPYTGIFMSLYFYFMNKKDRFLKFHILQGIGFAVAFLIIYFGFTLLSMVELNLAWLNSILVLLAGWKFYNILNLALICTSLLLMAAAYEGKSVRIPIIADMFGARKV